MTPSRAFLAGMKARRSGKSINRHPQMTPEALADWRAGWKYEHATSSVTIKVV